MELSLRERIAYYVPGISLDCVVFGYMERKLHVLLLKYHHANAWALPGGFLPNHAEMDEVISDILKARTGVSNVFLQQFHTFSSRHRSWEINEVSREAFYEVKSKWKEEDRPILEQWFKQRFISTAYFALIDSQNVTPVPDAISEACTWIPIDNLPDLVLDHAEMVNRALQYLRTQINYLPLGRELLSQKFTLSELQSLYEAVLGRRLDRGNFQRKMDQLKILIRHEKLMSGAQNKAPYLYSIHHAIYDELLDKGIGF